MNSALEGLLVADFSRVLAGPLVTMYLGDFGADVIKVERPGVGDDSRKWGPPFIDRNSVYFHSVNRNKRSVELDLTDAADLDRARALARRADVIIENFKVGTMDAFGLSYNDLRKQNPGVIYCSISGFGSGRGAGLVGYDFLVQAVGGLMSVTGPASEGAFKAGFPVADILSGLHALVGILTALHCRIRTGKGQHVEVNLLSCLLSSMVNQVSAYRATGAIPQALGNAHPQIVPCETVPVGNGSLALTVGNDSQFRTLMAVLGRPETADDIRFGTNENRVRHRSELIRLIAALAVDREPASLATELTLRGVPAGVVNDIGQAYALAESLGLQPAPAFADAALARSPQLANPIRMSDSGPSYRLAPPELGEHTRQIVGWLDEIIEHGDRPPLTAGDAS